MNRTDRLQAILIHLQSKSVVTAQEIADRFDICLRTVYRDIRALEEGGVPIGADAGLGYYLLDNYKLPPVSFSADEAAALIFSEKLMEKLTDKKIRQDFESALYKIKAILKPKEQQLVELLNSKISVINRDVDGDSQNTLYLSDLRSAMASKLIVEMTYKAHYNDQTNARLVEPIGLCNYNSRWHLFAWCHLRGEYRDFRLDRIIGLKTTEKHFEKENHISVDDYIKTIMPTVADANISIIVDKSLRKRIDESKHWYGFAYEEDLGDSVRLVFSNNEMQGFGVWLLNTGCMAIVERPQELQQVLLKFIDNTINGYAYLRSK